MRDPFPVRRVLLVLGCALATAGCELDEAHVYGIAQFGGSGQCGNSGMTHTVHTSTAAAFLAEFEAKEAAGDWDSTETMDNGDARGTFFTDASKQASGDDVASNAGADEPDVIYVHTHGSHSTSPAFSSLSMGNSAYGCDARTDENMLWNSDLQIAVIKACQSGDYDTWLNGGYRQQFTTHDSQFSVWNAFHGDSSCGNHVTTYVGDYAADSFYEGVGENWIDEAWDDSEWSDDDDCPVSIVMGSGGAVRDDMFEHGGFLDRKDTGAKTGSTIYFVCGCDPSSGRVLPD